MKKLMVMLLSLLLIAFVFGCAKEESVVENITAEPEDNITEPEPKENITEPAGNITEPEEPEKKLELTAEEASLVLDKLEPGSKIALSTPFKQIEIGEGYVFALAIGNILNDPYNFSVEIRLVKAEKRLNGGYASITSEIRDEAESWISYDEIIEIDQEESGIIPIKVIVGDEAVIGSYRYRIEVKRDMEGFFEDYAEAELSLKIT